MEPHHKLALIIAAAVAIPLVVFVGLQLLGINVDPLIIIGGLVVLWAFGTGSKAGGGAGPSNRGAGSLDAEAERRALAALQKRHTDQIIEEHQAGRISVERRNEQLRHILNAPPPSDPKGPGPRRPS